MTSPRYLWYTPASACMATLFVLSAIPALHPPGPVFAWKDKFYHAGAYFGLGVCLVPAVMARWPSVSMVRAGATVFGVATLYGVFDEIHQSFVPAREADIGDVVADAAGAALSLLLLPWLWKRLRPFLYR